MQTTPRVTLTGFSVSVSREKVREILSPVSHLQCKDQGKIPSERNFHLQNRKGR